MTATQLMTVVGRHSESGRLIDRGVLLPADLHVGDLLTVACIRASHHSMESPPLAEVKDGRTPEPMRRKSIADQLPVTVPTPSCNRWGTSVESGWDGLLRSEWPVLDIGRDISRHEVLSGATSTPVLICSMIEGPARPMPASISTTIRVRQNGWLRD
jgi:hypothetical protein